MKKTLEDILKEQELAESQRLAELKEIAKELVAEAIPAIMEQAEKLVITKHIQMLKGDKGDSPKAGVDYDIPKDGDPGKNYILTKADKREIAGMVTVPIVEKVIEKTEVQVIKEQPIITNEVDEPKIVENVLKEVRKKTFLEKIFESFSKTLSFESIARGLEKLRGKAQLDYYALKNLPTIPNEEETIRKSVGAMRGGGIGNIQHETFSISAGTSSVTTAHPIGGSGNAIFKASYENASLDKDVHYTISTNRRVINFVSGLQAQFVNNTTFSITYMRG
jgi:hypothetical protein